VYVRKNPTFELQQLVQLNGLIKFPGPYPRLDKYEKLSSYIVRAGGIKENADLTGAMLYRKKTQFFRENFEKKAATLTDSLGNVLLDSANITSAEALQEPISIDLYKALKYKNSKYDIILQDGDIIFIPEINPFVSVEGTVQSRLKLTFDKEHTNVGYYIDKAGGFGRRPWRNRIFVTYANGKSKRTKNFAFMHFFPKIEEGCVLTVPFRPEGKELSDSLGGIVTATIPIIVGTLMAKIIAKF
jgi:protein involved in polysaccharide export with SLBB domain